MWCKNIRNKKLKPLSQEVVNVNNQSTIFKLLNLIKNLSCDQFNKYKIK